MSPHRRNSRYELLAFALLGLLLVPGCRRDDGDEHAHGAAKHDDGEHAEGERDEHDGPADAHGDDEHGEAGHLSLAGVRGVSFMTVGEPQQEYRRTLGWFVLAFLALLFVVAYALKKEYWKDIH